VAGEEREGEVSVYRLAQGSSTWTIAIRRSTLTEMRSGKKINP
jgi:hypothetical protein